MTAAGAENLALLQAYEPVIRFTAGELFLPTAVEPYLAQSSLWDFDADGVARCVVAAGELTIERLVRESAARPDADLSLRFVDAPLGRRATRTWRRRPDRPVFRSGARFAQVGLLSRLLDALFRLGLLLRGSVPGGLAARAEQIAGAHLVASGHPYYGRVVRDGGYVVAQYWFFYAMNDWRSSFGGANDHEADWEQATVYLVEQADGEHVPAWVAFSAHDEVGDDLRRRWDDPELVRVGNHPVVFAGAGSHSGAFVAGDYVTAVQPPRSLRGLLRVFRAVAQVVTPWSRGELARGVGIPFVDYSRGDGEVIGPAGGRPWSPVLIDDATPWVHAYRGLWGLDTQDRFGGERAPAGPRYERGGAVRQSWSDPLSWAGLQKVPATPAEMDRLLRMRIEEIDDALTGADAELERRRTALRQLVAEVESLRGRSGFDALAAARRSTIEAQERALAELASARTAMSSERAAHVDTLARPRALEAPQAHLRHKHVPAAQVRDERTTFLRLWSTASGPLLLAAVALIVYTPKVGAIAGTATFAVAFLAIEAIARKSLAIFAVTLVVVVVGGLVALTIVQGVVGQWRIIVAGALALFAAAVLIANLRDLRRG